MVPSRFCPNHIGLVLVFATLLGVVGCGSERPQPVRESGNGSSIPGAGLTQPERVNPEGTIKLAVRIQNWGKAGDATHYLLDSRSLDRETGSPLADLPGSQVESQPIKTDTWVAMARFAHHEGQGDRSANFLQRACETEEFASPERVRQTIIAFVGVGRFYEAMDFIEEVLRTRPDQHENRRWLFDFYVGSDDRVAAATHGRRLVLARKFDVELLNAISNSERRRFDEKPLDEMVHRNPNDKRPLLGVGKMHFDLRELPRAIGVLEEVVAAHPDYQAAQAMLGRAYAAAGQFGAIESWAKQQSAGIERYPSYWIALGEWARTRGEQAAAIRAFGEATRAKDPDVLQVWLRLATLVNEAEVKDLIDAETVAAVQTRARLLSEFNRHKTRFEKTGSISRAIALDLAKTLDQLGRWWEAEAWASVALTMPEDDAVDVHAFRQDLVRRLSSETPWQVDTGHPEFKLALHSFPLPEIESVVSRSLESGGERVAGDPPTDNTGAGPRVKMDDEALARGLEFHGHTAKVLDQPGIMLFRTLGCGGGAIDFDRDGWSDLYLAAAGGTPPERDSSPNELFRNLRGTFVPVADLAGVGDTGFGQGIAVGDVNEDGFPDLLSLNYGPNRLYVNNGDGTFTDVSARLQTQPYDEWSSSAAIADMDGDGLSDIVLVNYCEGLGPVIQTCRMNRDSDQVASCSPIKFPPAADRFLRQTGDGSFDDVTLAWLGANADRGRGLGIVAGNFDRRPGNECLVANDMTNNHYYVFGTEEASPKLSESAMIRGVGADDRGIAQGSMGIAASDLDLDGDLDFYVTNFFEEYNSLHLQSSSGLWDDRTSTAGLIDETLPWVGFGTEAVDLDNNGSTEILITNGHVDLFSREHEKAQYKQPLQLFRRGRGSRFEKVDSRTLGDYFRRWHVGRSLWTVDADRDGRMDVVVTHQTEPAALLMNRTEMVGNWVRLELVGSESARDAIGSIVEVRYSTGTRYLWQNAGDGYQCSNERVLHLGLGDVSDQTVDVQVTWPGGNIQHSNVRTRRQTVLVERIN